MIKKLFSYIQKWLKFLLKKVYGVTSQIFFLIRERFFHVATPESQPASLQEENKGGDLLKRSAVSREASTPVISENGKEIGYTKKRTNYLFEEESVNKKTETCEIPPLLEYQHLSLCETLDRLLNTGVVIHGDITISVANIDLIYIGLRALISSVETARKLQDG